MNQTLLCSQRSRHENAYQGPARETQTSLLQHTSLALESQILSSKTKAPFLFGAVLVTTLLTGQAQAQNTPAKFVPFSDFVQSVRGTDASTFLASSAATAKVKEPAAFNEMRQHILNMYEGVNVSHSYVLGSQTIDCVPVSQQLSVRTLGLKKIAEPPNSSPSVPGGANQSSAFQKASQLPADKTADEFGNALGCETSTVPMTRLTMENLSHFKNLQEFFEKGPNGSGHPPMPDTKNSITPNPYDHKYAFMYQYVNNLGINANINLWRPYVYTDIGEIFSLAQTWTIGYSSGPVQTAEVGWQNFPGKYGTESSVPFIYWTADGYNRTGCYNLDCSGFVQVSSSVTFGAPFSAGSYSVPDGPQYEIQAEFYLYQGNWWLNFNGTWVGYYPGSLYGGGQLSRYANLVEFGSESVGYNVWPAEGSGLFAASGWTYAGYERLIYYIDLSSTGYWATLTPDDPSPSCYSTAGPYYASNWGVYFYFGGPGGASCE
ncbi:MAG: neprosin family prolyl endopeptidase [Acidobacteriaceae bacterium]|nr:neprosin family prolyl endopeptidase [Acidobacteriaceae bacterium]